MMTIGKGVQILKQILSVHNVPSLLPNHRGLESFFFSPYRFTPEFLRLAFKDVNAPFSFYLAWPQHCPGSIALRLLSSQPTELESLSSLCWWAGPDRPGHFLILSPHSAQSHKPTWLGRTQLARKLPESGYVSSPCSGKETLERMKWGDKGDRSNHEAHGRESWIERSHWECSDREVWERDTKGVI